MKLTRAIRASRQLPASVQWLVFKASLLSLGVWVALILLPYRWWSRWQGEVRRMSSEQPAPATLPFREDLAQALSIAARHIPWLKRCYVRALTGMVILRKKGVTGTLYIGFRTRKDGRFEGHAWLRAHDTWISGADRRGEFSVHAFYS